MGSPITLSGFNSIDFNSILTLLMEQERQPVTLLENQKTALSSQKTAFSTLASKLSTLRSAAQELKAPTAFDGTTATVSDPTRLAFSSGGTAPQGTFEILVNELARAQVTTGTAVASADTVVATGGSLTITSGGVDHTVTLNGSTTLQQLADAINATDDIGVSASVIRNSSGYQLMLTGTETGVDHTFSVANGLSGGASALTFANQQAATDASILVNNVEVTSSTNTFSGVIPGSTFTVMRRDTENPVVVTITASNESLKSLVDKIVTAFNDAVKFLGEQQAASLRGETSNIGRDPLVRNLRSALTQALTGSNTSGGGAYGSLAELGFTISRTGELSVNKTTLETALQDHKADVEALFFGTDGTDGVFGRFAATIDTFTSAGGLIPNAQTRLTEQESKLSNRIADMEERLEIKRAALQKEFIAADQALAQLNQAGNQIASMVSQINSLY